MHEVNSGSVRRAAAQENPGQHEAEGRQRGCHGLRVCAGRVDGVYDSAQEEGSRHGHGAGDGQEANAGWRSKKPKTCRKKSGLKTKESSAFPGNDCQAVNTGYTFYAFGQMSMQNVQK